MDRYAVELIHAFGISLGVVVGGSITGSLAAFLTGGLPMSTMAGLAEKLKIWGMVTAMGGTFLPIKNLETGLFGGQIGLVGKQLLFILVAFLGAHLGYVIVTSLAGGRG